MTEQPCAMWLVLEMLAESRDTTGISRCQDHAGAMLLF